MISQKFVIAGLAALGLVIFSPKVRHNLWYFLEQLAEAQRLKAQSVEAERIEAERRATLISEAIERIQLPTISESVPVLPPSPAASPERSALPASTEPDARWREVIVTPAVAVGNQQKWDTFVKERSGGDDGVLGLPQQFVVAFALG